MSGEELAELQGEFAAEAAPVEPPIAGSTESTGNAENVADVVTSADLELIVGEGVAVLGGIVCSRARVTPLTGDEIARLATAIRRVLDQYDFQFTGKGAAWVALGMVGLGVAGPRIMEAKVRKALPQPKPAADRPAASEEPLPAAGSGMGDLIGGGVADVRDIGRV